MSFGVQKNDFITDDIESIKSVNRWRKSHCITLFSSISSHKSVTKNLPFSRAGALAHLLGDDLHQGRVFCTVAVLGIEKIYSMNVVKIRTSIGDWFSLATVSKNRPLMVYFSEHAKSAVINQHPLQSSNGSGTFSTWWVIPSCPALRILPVFVAWTWHFRMAKHVLRLI